MNNLTNFLAASRQEILFPNVKAVVRRERLRAEARRAQARQRAASPPAAGWG